MTAIGFNAAGAQRTGDRLTAAFTLHAPGAHRSARLVTVIAPPVRGAYGALPDA